MFEGSIVPSAAVQAYVNGTGTLTAVFYPISETLVAAAPLILAGLAVVISFRSGLFNIGAQGQIVAGGLLAGWLGFDIHLPVVAHVLVALAGGIAGGAVFGWVVGGLAGLAGTTQILGTQFDNTPGLHSTLGFTAITIVLLGRNSPLGVVLAGLLFGALEADGTLMQASTGTPQDVVTVIRTLIVIFIATPPLVRAIFDLRGRRVGGEERGPQLSQGWGG